MLHAKTFQLRAWKGLHWLASWFESRRAAKRIDEFICQHQDLGHLSTAKLLDDVNFLCINGNGQIGRQRPWGRCPNHNACLSSEGAGCDRKLYKYRSVVAFL